MSFLRNLLDNMEKNWFGKGAKFERFYPLFEAADTFRTCLELIVNSGHVSCLNVLKRFGPGNPGLLSFPMPGWTLTVDLPIEEGLDQLCDQLDEQVAGAGGRVYLAKDSRLSPEMFRRMYPRVEEFLRVRRQVDPAGHQRLQAGVYIIGFHFNIVPDFH